MNEILFERSGKVARGGSGEDMLVVKSLAVEFYTWPSEISSKYPLPRAPKEHDARILRRGLQGPNIGRRGSPPCVACS